jgi:hypothetical protein
VAARTDALQAVDAGVMPPTPSLAETATGVGVLAPLTATATACALLTEQLAAAEPTLDANPRAALANVTNTIQPLRPVSPGALRGLVRTSFGSL